MRLIRSKVFRAFPELDRFSDDQCRRFVSAANSSKPRRLLRWLLVGGVAALGSLAVAYATLFIALSYDTGLYRKDWQIALFAAPPAILAFGIVFFVALILRDGLLRFTIRRIIQRFGACLHCHYSLLGIPLASDNTIICPECGRKHDADPTLGELTTDESGATVYKPMIAQHRAEIEALARVRRRRFARVSAIILLLILIPPTSWVLFLLYQAHRASTERTAIADIHALQIAMWPPAPDKDDADEFSRYAAILFAAANAISPQSNSYTKWQGRASFDGDTLVAGADENGYNTRNGEHAFADTRAFTLEALGRARELGIPAKMRELLALKIPVRQMAPRDSFLNVMLSDLGDAHGAARLNAARMVDALQHADRREYEEALEETLLISQIIDRQGLLIDRQVAMGIRWRLFKRLSEDIPRFQDAGSLEGVLAILDRRKESPSPLSSVLEVTRLAGLDSIQWFFADPKRVAKAQLGIDDLDPFGYRQFGLPAPAGSLGTYASNKAAWNELFSNLKNKTIPAAATTLPVNRQPFPSVPTGLVIVDTLAPQLDPLFSLEDNLLYERRRCFFGLAAQRFFLRSGHPPASPDDLLPFLSDRSALIDPLSGKPFRIMPREATSADAHPFEIRDGEDDEPKLGQPTKPRSSTDKPPATK